MTEVETLNQDWGISDRLVFALGKGDMPVVNIQNELGRASIALQGAHVLSFQPTGEDEVIWMSEDATFAPGKSLRGGMPVCWPWFGAHESDSSLPGHGYARTVHWKPVSTKQLDDGNTYICLELDHSTVAEKLKVHALDVQLHINVGHTLRITLETRNTGDHSYNLSEALHTYFHVGDVREVRVQGLDGAAYLDKMDDFARKQQNGDITIDAETDRVYLDVGSEIRIIDPVLQRTIIIASEHSHSAIIWNPWVATAQKMGDLGPDGYLKMLCVETANAADNVIFLEAGKHHQMSFEYRIERIS